MAENEELLNGEEDTEEWVDQPDLPIDEENDALDEPEEAEQVQLATGYVLYSDSELVNNDQDVEVSYPKITLGSADRPGSIPYYYITNAKLNKRMYDCHVIRIRDNAGTNFADPVGLLNFVINIREATSYRSKNLTFNMGDRKFVDDSTYEPSGGECEEAVFYDPYFTYSEESGFYELMIYIAARSNGPDGDKGFNDAVVTVIQKPQENRDTNYSVRYRTVLPPYLIQGEPVKKYPDEEDPVFPTDASRVDIGVDTIRYYYENAHGYNRDYLFTNNAPFYEVNVSGLMPSFLGSDFDFENVSGFLVNDMTEAKIPLTTYSAMPESGSITLDVMTIDNAQYTAGFYLREWKVDLEASAYSGTSQYPYTHKNTVVVSGELRMNEPEEDVEVIVANGTDGGTSGFIDNAGAGLIWCY